ncbi:GGDEF domain-containing protein [Shewanella sp. HL-SH8]|uniref:GGDEF domain-containing protein n=1 Tax=Shewanella sp. HL-SH8 TaxID=3436242 RepID=UPI003EB73D86
MDNLTLTVSAALISIFMFLTSFLLYLSSKSDKYLIDWSFAGLAFFFNSVVVLVGSRQDFSYFLIPSLVNAFYVMGHAALLSGTLKLTTGKSQPFMVLGLGIAVITLHYFDFTQSSVTARFLIFYPIIILLCLSNIYVAIRHIKSSTANYLKLLVIIQVTFVLLMMLRIGYVLLGNDKLHLFGNEILQTSGTLLLLSFLFLMTLNFVFISNWKKEYQLNQNSRTDYLTGWLNRRALNETASTIFAKCQREGKKFGFIIIDIDHFKVINDTYGHAIGDKAIKHICSTAEKSNRAYDFHFRLGGEEFAVLFDDTEDNHLKRFADRMRENIEKSPLMQGHTEIKLTVSIGVTISQATDEHWEQVLDRADKALYQAKSNGRNKVEVVSELQLDFNSAIANIG